MKKKIISSLLAVAMMMSVALPSVFAASSDVAGDAKKVTKITADADTYTIKVGDTIKFNEKIAVYEDNSKLVLDHNHIRYMLNGNTGSGLTGDFRIVGDEVTAVKAGATATLTIFDNYNASSNARVTVNLRTVPADGTLGWAESFTFKSSNYQAIFTSPTGTSEGLTVVAKAHPSGTKFDRTDARVDAAIADVKAKLSAALGFDSSASTMTGDFTNGIAAVKGVYSFIIGSGAVANGSLTFANVTGVTTVGLLAASDTTGALVATKLAAVINAAPIAEFVAAVAGDTLTLTAKTAGVIATAPTLAADADDTEIVINNTTPASGGGTVAAARVITTGTAATAATIVYDLDGHAFTENDVLTIAGKSMTVGTNQTSAANVATGFVAKYSALGDVITGYTASVTNSDEITLTANTAGVTTIPTTAQLATNLQTAAANTDVVKDEYQENDTEIKFTIDAAYLTAAQKALAINNAAVNVYNNYKVLKTSDLLKFYPQAGNFNASANLEIVDAIAAVSFSVPSSIDVVVGKIVKAPVTYYPPNANVNKKALFSVASSKNDGKAYQYAVVNSDTNPTEVGDEVEILGVNSAGTTILTGKVKGGTLSAWSTINVKSTDFNADVPYTSKIDKTTVEVAVGSIVPVSITGLPTNVTVKWTHKDDGTIALNKAEGPAVAINGKKIGTNTITATLSNGEKFTVAVTVKAAAVTPPASKPGAGTDVPQTGDALLANLF